MAFKLVYGLATQGRPALTAAEREARLAIAAVQNCSEKTWQALAHWYAARVYSVMSDGERAREQLQLGFNAIADTIAPIAEWRLHTLAYQLYGSVEDRALSSNAAKKLFDSFAEDDPTRTVFQKTVRELL